MRFKDILKLSQTNLVRAKLRTFLTVGAVFIGVLTISLTNGVGNGVRSYVDLQLGNVGAENTLLIQAKQSQQNPVASEVVEYNPNRQIGTFNVVFLSLPDIAKIQALSGIREVTPFRDPHIEYITTGEKKYQATITQYVEGFNIEMAAGTVIQPGTKDTLTLPSRYLEALKLGTAQEAIGKSVILAFKDSGDVLRERRIVIAGVQERTLLGSADINISAQLAEEIYNVQTLGIAGLADRYVALIAKYDPNFSDEDLTTLKKTLGDAGYSARTIEDQIGVISQVINTVLLVLNIFGAIALLAATFGIVNTLLMAVNERTSEIGLMKALGANRKTIFAIFAAEAASIGFWGGLLGILASIGIGTIANRLAENTFLKNLVGLELLSFPILPSLGILVGVIVLAFVAGALPSLKASKLDPIRALRYE